MKIVCYFLLNIKHGASQLYWGARQIQLRAPPVEGWAGGGALWGPGVERPQGAYIYSLAPALTTQTNAAAVTLFSTTEFMDLETGPQWLQTLFLLSLLGFLLLSDFQFTKALSFLNRS